MYKASKIILLPYYFIFIKYKKFQDINKLLDFSFSPYSLIQPMQERDEICELLNILKTENPKNILEIGTANGGTLFLFSRISDKNAKIISIDLPNGKFGGGYKKWRTTLYKSFILKEQSIHLLRKDSHEEETLYEVNKILNKEKLDLLFIDGDHTYSGAKLDFEMYSPLVKKNGYIIFHDIVIAQRLVDFNGGVSDFWNSIKNHYEFKEIVKDWNQERWGIGLIKL